MMDIMKLPKSSDGLDSLLVLIDSFTGFILLEPLMTTDASSIARTLWKMFCIIGPPKIIEHDQESSFMDKILTALYHHEGIEQRVISSYHPQANGKVERTIQTIRNILNKHILGLHELWPLYVPFIQLLYNYHISELSGSSPFSLMFGRTMNEFIDYTNEQHYTKLKMNDWKKHQDELLSLIFPAVQLRVKHIQEKYIKMFQKHKKYLLEHDLPAGTKVMIRDPEYIKSPETRPKDESRFIGPYFIVKRTLHGPYVLKDKTGMIYERVVPIDQMKIITMKPHQIDYEADSDLYHMDYIVNDRMKDGRRQYLIKWTGYPNSQNTWEDASAITDRKILKRYQRKKSALKSVEYDDVTGYVYLISSHDD